MARPIAPTPDFEGEAAEKLIREMLEPPSEKHKKLVEEMKKDLCQCFNYLLLILLFFLTLSKE